MTKLAPSVSSNLAGWFRLTLGSIIDIAVILFVSFQLFSLLSGTWETLSGAPVEPPVIGFMSTYSAPAQNGYWLIVLISMVSAALLNAVGTLVFGASIGKAIVGVKFVTFDGPNAPLSATLKKSAFNIGLFLLAAMPGPIFGFVFGTVADFVSLVCLLLAAAIAFATSCIPHGSGLFAAYRWAKIAPVVRRQHP